MKRLSLTLACTLLAATALCDNAKPKRSTLKDMTPEQREKLRELRMRQNGGFLDVEGKGHLAVLNAQQQFGEADVTNSLEQLKAFVRGLQVKFLPASFSVATAKAEREKSGAGACVFLVDDPSLPMSLIALEEGWGVVNIAPLKDGNPSAEKLALRFKKEFVRVSSVVFSGCKSQYKTSPLQGVSSLAELDKTIGENYGIDTVMAIATHLPEIGVICAKKITYREACQRGIAPQPTNEYQKAIWDQVHELPSQPIQIKK